MCDTLNVSYDRFIRTSQPDHYRASQAIWAAMEERGDLYLDRYEGWYSVRDEAYYEPDELTDADDGAKLSPHGTPVEWTVEESWFFRLSKYQQPLLDLYAANPDFIQPDSRRNEVLRFVEGGLKDLSISRTSFDWGVPVPGSDNHVMYVWLDALTNYLTGLGYPDETELWQRYWPANVHLIGKDVVRFHAVYWPAFLMSAGIALPKQVYGHGFLLSRGEKMSKSVGNVVDPMVLAERFGVDALRYFLLREVPFGQDGSYSAEAIVARANAELANSFGNLAQRSLSMIFKNLDGVLPQPGSAGADRELLAVVEEATKREVPDAFERLAFSQGIEAWLRAVFACNQYVDTQAPWALRKTDPERMAAVLGTIVVAVRELARGDRSDHPRIGRQIADLDRRRQGRGADPAADAVVSQARARRGRGGGRVRLIDSHCHLNYEGLVERQDEVLENARARGVHGFLNISTRQKEWNDVIARRRASCGRLGERRGPSARGRRSSRSRRGGLDRRHITFPCDRDRRVRPRLLLRQVRPRGAARALRGAYRRRAADRPATHRPHPRRGGGHGRDPRQRGQGRGRDRRAPLLHRLGRAGAQGPRSRLLSSRCRGIVTFKNAADLQDIAKWLPADQMLVETDAPFLAPVPHRGQKCEPAFVADTAAFVAELRGEELEALGEATTANFFKLFSKAA